MSKIEQTIRWAKDREEGANSPMPGHRRRSGDRMLRRRVSGENEGEKWIKTLHVEPTQAGEAEESRVLLDENQDQRVRSAYKMLRTRVLHRIRQNGWHVIGVTSPLQGDGKSLTSINLALSLAAETTLSVVLLELDLRRPAVCSHFNVDPAKGLPDYLDGAADLEEVLFRPEGTERLAVLPNTEIFENSSEMLSSPKLANLVDELRGDDEGRVVVCDLPPYLATDDALAFVPLADAFLIVVSEGRTSRDALGKGVDILHELPLLGLVLNRSESATSAYYYY
jgi:capsular exopolysaccharide synthesis family protein